MFSLQNYLKERAAWIESELDRRMPASDAPPRPLHEVMRYSVFAGGKRIRPVLCLAAAEAVGARPEGAMLPALALEILHTYTLIHDDLPCMDDDALRRGKPTAHVKFGEANAVLAGDALLTLAFEWMAGAAAPPPYPPGALALELATASGSSGVIAGQVEDLAAEQEPVNAERLRFIHLHKTASLIRAAVRMGGMAAKAPPDALEALTRYGEDIGLAFQVVDDILNVVGTEELGKPTGSDAARGKATYVALYGIDAARKEAEDLVGQAERALQHLPGDVEPLSALARHVVERTR